jgi:hypothetical protein
VTQLNLSSFRAEDPEIRSIGSIVDRLCQASAAIPLVRHMPHFGFSRDTVLFRPNVQMKATPDFFFDVPKIRHTELFHSNRQGG